MMRRLQILLGVLILIVLVAFYEILWAPNSFEGDRFVTVSKGDTFRQVIDSLQSHGIIRNRTLFDLAGRTLRLTTRMQIGKYRFKSGMSNKEILEDLRYGKTIELVMVHIPEGLRMARQAFICKRVLGIDSARFMALAKDTFFVRSLGVPAPTLEGFLLPNSYKFYWQTDEEDVIREMVAQFWGFFNDTLKAYAAARGRSINDILTIASIVEAETAVDSERAIVAGVYYNRLEKRMRLEADPTIQYILEDGPRRLRYSDLKRESAYNTYRHYGLPPSPINNPGEASILAALYPVRHKYLFFVANGIGGHTFTRTYGEHRKAIELYRKKKVEEALKQDG